MKIILLIVMIINSTKIKSYTISIINLLHKLNFIQITN